MNNERHSHKRIEEYPDVLDAKMIAEILGIGYLKSLEILKSQYFPVIKIKRTYRVSKSEFIKWLNNPSEATNNN